MDDHTGDQYRVDPNPTDIDYTRRGYCAEHGGYLGHCQRCSDLARKALDGDHCHGNSGPGGPL